MIEPTNFIGLFMGIWIYRKFKRYEYEKKVDKVLEYIIEKDMGAVYKKVEQRKQKGRYIYNRNRLHKVGWEPKHKKKYREKMKEMLNQIKEING